MTIIYNVPATADSSATLATGGIIRYGIELNGAGGALVGKPIKTFTVSLKKGAVPTGNITAVIRRASDDAIVATFQESPLATSLTTSFLPYTFTLATPYTLVNGDKIMIEYSGANGISIEVYSTDQFDGALTRRVRFTSPTYATGNTNDIVATIDDGLTPSATSFTPTSFTSTSFTGGGTVIVVPPIPTTGGGSTSKKRNKFRNYINRLAFNLKNLFKIKQRKPEDEPEEIEIPPAQPPQKTVILPGPPKNIAESTRLATIKDKWSIVASTPPPEKRTEVIYYPLNNPLIQTKVILPNAVIKQSIIPPYQVGQGSHIESAILHIQKPKNRSKTASTLNTLMILLDMESRI